MKICVIPPQNLPVPAVKGGAVEGLIDLLISENENQKKMDILVLSIYDKEAKEKSRNFKYTKFIYIRYFKILDKIYYILDSILQKYFNYNKAVFFYTLIIQKKLKKFNFDFIIIESADPRLTLSINRNKTIGHIHGHMQGTSLMKKRFYKFIAISDYIKEEFLKNSDILEQDVIVLKNCIDLKKYQTNLTQKEAKRLITISENEKMILFVGRIIPEKGIKELIIAFKMLVDPTYRLVIVGSSNFGLKELTNFEKEILNLISSDNRIIYKGFIQNNELNIYYKAADVCVMPSKWEEPAGLVALESLAAGKHLIITKTGGIPEYVGDDEVIFIENNKNLVKNLLTSIPLVLNKEEMDINEKGLQKVKEFSKKEYYNNYYNILYKLKKELTEGEL